jgi:hypothetical protein
VIKLAEVCQAQQQAVLRALTPRPWYAVWRR